MAKELLIRFKNQKPEYKTYILEDGEEPGFNRTNGAVKFTDTQGRVRMFNWDIIRYIGIAPPSTRSKATTPTHDSHCQCRACKNYRLSEPFCPACGADREGR